MDDQNKNRSDEHMEQEPGATDYEMAGYDDVIDNNENYIEEDEAEHIDTEWADDFDDFDEDVQDDGDAVAASGKKSQLLNYAIYGVGGIVVLFILYTQLGPMLLGGGQSQQQQPSSRPPLAQNTPQNSNTQQQSMAQQDNAANDQSAMLNNEDGFGDIMSDVFSANNTSVRDPDVFDALDGVEIPMPSTISTDIEDTDTDVQQQDESEIQVEELAATEDVDDPFSQFAREVQPNLITEPLQRRDAQAKERVSEVEEDQLPETEVVETSPVMQGTNDVQEQQPVIETMAIQEDVSANMVSEEALSSIDKKLESMTARLAELEARQTQMQNQETKVNTASSVDSEQISDLKSMIVSLQKKVDDLANRPATERVVVKEVPVQQKAAPAPVKVSSPAPQKTAAPVEKNISNQWVLRGVTRDSALIATSSSSDILTVSVGDQVPNLGRIQSIAMENGAWVVKTSGGIIRQ